jgi:hypothetical protein
MEQETFTLRNAAGRLVSLNGPTIYVVEHDGLGEPPVRVATQTGPYQEGQLLTNEQWDARTITLKLVILGDESQLQSGTDLLHLIFNRSGGACWLDVTRVDGTTLRLQVRRGEGWQLPRKADDVYNQLVDVVQLVADDPIAYNPEDESVYFALPGGGTGLPIPMRIPFTLGTPPGGAERHIVNYAGTWRAYPLIHIQGPIVNPVIRNVTTGKKLDFTGHSLAAGEYIDIDCRYGRKTVIQNGTTNILGKLTSDSDLAAFSIVPADEAVNGINEIRADGSGRTTATYITLRYNACYISVL